MEKRKYRCRVFEKLQIKVIYFVDVNYYLYIFSDIKDGMYDFSIDELNKINYENVEEYKAVIENFDLLEKNICNMPQKYSKEITGEFVLCLHPSNICNLNCEYCFRDMLDNNIELSFDMAKRAIDFLINDYAPNASKYIVDLSGSGEPLIRYDLVEKITDYCNTLQDKLGKSIAVMFATNGTIELGVEQIKYLEENVTIGVSLDGNAEINDYNRHNQYGVGTYEKTISFMNQFPNKKFGVAVTITPKNQCVSKIYDDLANIDKINCISMKPLRNFNGSCFDTDKLDVARLVDEYVNLCYNIVNHMENGDFEYFKCILTGNDFFGKYLQRNIHKNYRNYYACDAGYERIAIDSKGDIYACTVLIGNDNFKIGNIKEGINIIKHEFYNEIDTEKDDKCKNCYYKWICGGECYANSYLSYRNIYKPINKLCELRMELIELSICFLEYIKRNNFRNYCKMMIFLNEVNTYHKSNSCIWAIIQILNYKRIDTKYKLIESVISYDTNGIIKPISVLACLNSYGFKYKIFNLNSISLFNEICYPCISIVNKVDGYNYDFVVIESVDVDYIYYKTIYSIKECMKKRDFLKNVSNIFITEKKE